MCKENEILVEAYIANVLTRNQAVFDLFGRERSMSGLNASIQALPFGTSKILTDLFWEVTDSLKEGQDTLIRFQRTKIPDCFTDSE